MNKAIIIGRVGRDPEVRTVQNGDPVANLSVATSERWKDRNTGERREKTEWHRVTLWGPLAKVAEQYVNKGDQVCIEGKIETRKWQDQSGQDRYSTEIRGEKMEMLGGGSREADEDKSEYASATHEPHPGAHGGQTTGGGDLDDEIPFAPEWR